MLTLRQALENTKAKRKSVFEFSKYNVILDEISRSDFQRQLWGKYQKQYSYARETDFDGVIKATKRVLNEIFRQQ